MNKKYNCTCIVSNLKEYFFLFIKIYGVIVFARSYEVIIYLKACLNKNFSLTLLKQCKMFS